MRLYLSSNTKIKDVKEAYNKEFPYLKFEFFNRKHLPGEGNPNAQKVPETAKLIEITGVMREGLIEINSYQTVSQVEQLFQQKFYLPVQIFRNSGSTWIETTKTDYLSLQKQNKMGREASHPRYDLEILL